MTGIKTSLNALSTNASHWQGLAEKRYEIISFGQ